MRKKFYEPDWSIGLPVYPSLRAVLESNWLYIINFLADQAGCDDIDAYGIKIVRTRCVCEIHPSDNWVSAKHPDVCACPITLDITELEYTDVEWIVVVDRSGRR